MYDNSVENTYGYLDMLHIPYKKLTDSTNDGISGRKTCEALGLLPSEVYKTIMVLSNKKNHPYIAVLPADRKLDLDKFGAVVGTLCHPAGAHTIREICSEPAGLFGPFFPPNIVVCLDSSVIKRRTVVVNAGGAGNYIELSVSDLISAAHCKVGDLTAGYTVELYGRNHALTVNTIIDTYMITSLRNITPLEIFYEAQERVSGQKVMICEFFPRFHGVYASRSSDGEGVKWLTYPNDMQPRYTPDYFHIAQSRYRSCFERQNLPDNPKVIHRIERNDTFYTVFEPVSGEPLTKVTAERGALRWEDIRDIMLPLFAAIREGDCRIGCIRPDTFFLDLSGGKANLLPFCAPTDLFGKSNGMRFSYNSLYDPFIEKDEEALLRVLCYALAGEKWIFYCRNRAEILWLLKDRLPRNDADEILKEAW